MSNPGFIYILTNPSLVGIVKIGKTTRSPANRVAELSSATGVPTPFQLVYYAEFADCDAAERALHGLFTDRNARVADNREFFRIAPHEAITAVVTLHTRAPQAMPPDNSSTDNQTDEVAQTPSLVNELIDDAIGYLDGTDGKYIDIAKAASIFRNAADLGSADAYFFLGTIYRIYDETHDLQKAKVSFQKGAELGNITCNAHLALTFVDLGEMSNAEKAWARLFSNAHQLSPYDRGLWALQCVEHIAKSGLSRQLAEVVKPFAEDMALYVEEEERKGIPEASISTRKTLLDLANYTLFGTVPTDSLAGKIKWFDHSKGFGFVTGDDRRDYFILSSNILSDSVSPQEGRRVRFQGVAGIQGPVAVNVLIK